MKVRGEIVLKIVNRAVAPRSAIIKLDGCGTPADSVRVITLSHEDPTAENSLDDPEVVVPRETVCEIPGGEFRRTLPANSLTVLRVPVTGRRPSR